MDRFLRRIRYSLLYFRSPPWDTGISPPELMAFISNHPAGRALDLGCGTGTNVITLAKNGWQVTGIDFVGKAIARAQQKARQHRVQVDLRVADVTNLADLKAPYDLILDMGCFHSLSDSQMKAYQRNIHRLLTPGGIFLLYAFFRTSLQDTGPGVTDEHLEQFSRFLTLVQRQDGTERGLKPSAWFTYQMPTN